MSHPANPFLIQQDWLEPVAQMLARHGRRGGFAIDLGVYRPDLSQAMAHRLNLAFLDFRAACMAEHGWNAARLPLERIEDAAAAASAGFDGVVIHNGEALLAAKPEAERRSWLAVHCARSDGPAAVLPMSVFVADLPAASTRVVRIDPVDLPAEVLILRMATSA